MKQFIQGANEVLKIVKFFGVKEFIGKQESPACGCGKIYEDNFTEMLINGDGVATALLKKN